VVALVAKLLELPWTLLTGVVKKTSNWWTRRKVQEGVRRIAETASRGMGGYEDLSVIAKFIGPTEVTRVQIDPRLSSYEMVQVKRETDYLVIQSALYTLRDQFQDIKEYLPLDAVQAFEFAVLYASTSMAEPRLARIVREELEKYRESRPDIDKWFEKFAFLLDKGVLRGLVVPYLKDVRNVVPIPDNHTRKDCITFTEWVYNCIRHIEESSQRDVPTKIPDFPSQILKIRIGIVPVADLNWAEYCQAAVFTLIRDTDRVVFCAFGIYHAEKAFQAAASVGLMIPAFSVERVVATGSHGNRVLALYIYIAQIRDVPSRAEFRSKLSRALRLSPSEVRRASSELDQSGMVLVTNGESLRDFSSYLFDIMINSDASIIDQEIWREGTELKVLLLLSRKSSVRSAGDLSAC